MRAATVVGIVIQVGLAATTQQPRFASSTSLVRLEVSVLDDRGAVRELKPAEFVVEDSGVRQVVQVEEAADAPLDLVLVAQPMDSVAYTAVEQTSRVAAGLSAFLEQIQSRDRLGAFSAGAPPKRLRPLEFGRPSFDVRAFESGEYAAPFDAIAAALREFVPSERRRALVAFTNAADFRSIVSFESIAEMTRRLGPAFVLVGTPVQVYEQVMVQSQMSGGRSLGDAVVGTASGSVFPSVLQLLARRTGGITVDLASGDPRVLIEGMFAWLRTQYIISYTPPGGKGWHPVNVRVNRKGVTVTVRDGYFVD